jgi:hypothetical protein
LLFASHGLPLSAGSCPPAAAVQLWEFLARNRSSLSGLQPVCKNSQYACLSWEYASPSTGVIKPKKGGGNNWVATYCFMGDRPYGFGFSDFMDYIQW